MKVEDLYGAFLFLVLVLAGACLSISHLGYGDTAYPGLILAARADCHSRKKSQGLSVSDSNINSTLLHPIGEVNIPNLCCKFNT